MTKLTIQNSLEKLSRHDRTFMTLFRHGSLEIEFYVPDKVDLQKPHSRDEIYVIATGTGEFLCGHDLESVEAGDVLFVPAGKEHRFQNFTPDFSAWVFFYGPEGGEKDEK